MDSNKVIFRESLYIAAITFVFNVILQILLFIFDVWNTNILLCNALGYICGVMNFFLLGMSLKSAVSKDDDDSARRVIGLSRILRIIIIFAAVLVGSLAGDFNVIFVLIPLLFPRFAIALRQYIFKE